MPSHTLFLEIKRFVHDSVSDSAVRLLTDEHPAYLGIMDDDTMHEAVKHSPKEYVRGDVHTNSIEGAFGCLSAGSSGRSIRCRTSIWIAISMNLSSSTTTGKTRICSEKRLRGSSTESRSSTIG
jgi:hypothetical protein